MELLKAWFAWLLPARQVVIEDDGVVRDFARLIWGEVTLADLDQARFGRSPSGAACLVVGGHPPTARDTAAAS